MKEPLSEIKWAPRVSKSKIRKLYQSEAVGLLDEVLLDEVGISFYLRCQSVLTVGRAQRGEVECPRCAKSERDTTIERQTSRKEEVLRCSKCSWHLTWGEYRKTYQGKQLNEGGVGRYLRAFVIRYEKARTPKKKILAVDQVIHEFHYNTVKNLHQPTRAACVNLIEGKLTDVVAFLNELTYGNGTDKRMIRTRDNWKSTLDGMSKWHLKSRAINTERIALTN